MADVDGNRLLSMTTNLVRNRAVIDAGRGGALVLEGNAWGRGFTIRDAEDRCLVRAGSEKASAAAPDADDVVLVENPGVLDLAEIISIGHIWRMAKKAAIASSTAASSTVARGT